MRRVRDPALAGRVTDAERSWWSVLMPVSTHVGQRVSGLDLRGRTASCFQHVTMNTSMSLLPLVAAGARVRVAAVNPDSTNDVAAAFLADQGVETWAWSGMTEAELHEGLSWLLSEPADAFSDMGGELIAGSMGSDGWPAAALEATTTGLHRLSGLEIPFAVFDWNSIALKDRLHNRHHIGFTAWPAFSAVTGLALHGRSVLVVGFGPVGRGVALQARALGAVVSVAETDPVRALEAQHHGCRDVSLEEGLATSSIVVTATGVEGVLAEAELQRLRDGAILVNVGHSNREIDVDWLDRRPRETVRPALDRYTIGDRHAYLVNRGSLVNLSPTGGGAMDEFFDPFAAIILAGLAWILDGEAQGAEPGLQPYPEHLEREIAGLARRSRA